MQVSTHFTLGSNRVLIATWNYREYEREWFRLRAALPTRPLLSVLCEKAKGED